MADPFSVAAGAVGVVSLSVQLLGGCVKGFILLSTARNLGKDASTIQCMLYMQEVQLVDWAKRAGLLMDDGVLEQSLNQNAIEQTLQQLQNLLLDTEKLKRRYGLTLGISADDQQQTIDQLASVTSSEQIFTALSSDTRRLILARSRIDQQNSVVKRLRWAMVDKEKIEKLVADVHFFVQGLWGLLNPVIQDQLLRSTKTIASNMISLTDKFDQLHALNEMLMNLKSQPGAVSEDPAFENLATSAALKSILVDFGAGNETHQSGSSRLYRQRRASKLSRCLLTGFSPMEKNDEMGLGEYDERTVFIEEKSLRNIAGKDRGKLVYRAENLATLLSLPKTTTFGSLVCDGFVEQYEKLSFVFKHPIPTDPKPPKSLLELFSAKTGIEPPSLSSRIKIALQITRIVRNFHRAGWLHKNLRSENILFFSPTSLQGRNNELPDPLLAGFVLAREDTPTEISEDVATNTSRDIYRHPLTLGPSPESFSAEMDIYSLGIVLLEIAEWRALHHLIESVIKVSRAGPKEILRIRALLLEGTAGTSKLRMRAGDVYSSVCFMCLKGKIEEVQPDKDVLGSVESILDVAVRKLESCVV